MSFLSLDPSAATAWNAFTPVLMPVGAATNSGIVAASMGVFVPFLLFLIAFFSYLYGLWYSNSSSSSSTSNLIKMVEDDAAAIFMNPTPPTKPLFFNATRGNGPPPFMH
jgi:hypothetical protein